MSKNLEEDIAFLEGMTNEYRQFGELYNEDYDDNYRIYRAIDDVLAAYKDLKNDFNKANNIAIKNMTEYVPKKEYEELKAQNKELETQYLLQKDLINSNEYISIQKVKDKIEEIQEEYSKLDEQVDEYIKSAEKDVSTYYENKERISIMQTLSWVIDNLNELLEESEEKDGEGKKSTNTNRNTRT